MQSIEMVECIAASFHLVLLMQLCLSFFTHSVKLDVPPPPILILMLILIQPSFYGI